MPFPGRRICIFGDSHFACARLAFDQGLVDAAGFDVEFWGNIGRQFRHLAWRNDRIEPLDDYTAGRFAKTNAMGRRHLSAADFDAILFMGCRIDLFRLFPEALHRRRAADHGLSQAVETRWLGDFMRRMPPYQFAARFAAQGGARILMAPVSFDTDGFDETIPDHFARAREAGPEDRAAIWRTIAAEMNRDGITLIAQPESTVVSGCCTDPRFAVARHVERKDRTHKNPEYGALILSAVFEKLRAE